MSEDVAGQAFGMHPHQDGVGHRHVAPDQRQVLGAVDE